MPEDLLRRLLTVIARFQQHPIELFVVPLNV